MRFATENSTSLSISVDTELQKYWYRKRSKIEMALYYETQFEQASSEGKF